LPPDKRSQIAHDTVRVAAYIGDPGGLVSREFRAPVLRAKARQSSGVLTVKLGQTLQGGTHGTGRTGERCRLPGLCRDTDPRRLQRHRQCVAPADGRTTPRWSPP